jgi:hypothetical protein
VPKAALIGESKTDVIAHGENAEDHDLDHQGPGAPWQHETKHHKGDQQEGEVNAFFPLFQL